MSKKQNNQSFGDVPDEIYGIAQDLLLPLRDQDPDTYYHCLRVGEYARQLARDLGLNEYQQKQAEFSGIFHDVGKKEISFEILHKPSSLTAAEYDIVKAHPLHSEQLLEPFQNISFISEIIPVVRGHHERVDGTGYPDKKRGDEVPLLARVVLIVDTLDAMGANRAYRKGLPTEVIYSELSKYAGTQFDAHIVREFLRAHEHWKVTAEHLDPWFLRSFKQAA